MKKILIPIAICGSALPVAVVLTLLLFPFWDWFEKQTGIESLGHSGPAEWCFAVVYLGILGVGFVAWAVLKKKRQAKR